MAEDQAEFEIGETSGTLVGFWSPHFVGFSLTLPGFHFHFLSGGGGLLVSEGLVLAHLRCMFEGVPLTLPGFHFRLLSDGCCTSRLLALHIACFARGSPAHLACLIPCTAGLPPLALPIGWALGSAAVAGGLADTLPSAPCLACSSLPVQTTGSGVGTCWSRSCWRGRPGCRWAGWAAGIRGCVAGVGVVWLELG